MEQGNVTNILSERKQTFGNLDEKSLIEVAEKDTQSPSRPCCYFLGLSSSLH